MREWWTLERSIVLFLLLHPFFLPEQHLFTVALPSFLTATAHLQKSFWLQRGQQHRLLWRTLGAQKVTSSRKDYSCQYFLSVSQHPNGAEPPPLKYPSALRLLTQLSFFCYQFTTPVKEEAQAYYLNSPSAGWYGPGGEERKPGGGFDSLLHFRFWVLSWNKHDNVSGTAMRSLRNDINEQRGRSRGDVQWSCWHYLSDQVTNMWDRQDAPPQAWLCFIISWCVPSSSCSKQFQRSWLRFAPSSISKTRVFRSAASHLLSCKRTFHLHFSAAEQSRSKQTCVVLNTPNHSCSTGPVFGGK